jgi:hypothetical protein
MKLLHVLCLVLITSTAVFAGTYSAGGFEAPTFAPGPLDGQDGWTGSSAGGGLAPVVVTAPDPVIGEQAVRLYVGPTQGDVSEMDHAIDPVWPMSGVIVTVSYDIYRNPDPWAQNLWWWWWDAGEPTYGLQWDIDGTLPNGWSTGAGSAPTVVGRYANIKMVWNFTEMKAYSWYDGALVDNGIPISGITELSGWTIYLSHDADTGTSESTVWIDNFNVDVVPEPGSLFAMATGLVGLGGFVLRRRR